MLNIKVILGSTRENRFGEKAFNWVKEQLKDTEDIKYDFLDLRDWELPYFNSPISASNPEFKQTTELAQKWENKIQEADAFIILTPEYNRGYPAVLKSALDATYKPWNNKSIGFISWGSVGGARVVEQLKQVAIELQLHPIREAVHIMKFWEIFNEKGQIIESAADEYNKKLESMVKQLVWIARSLKDARLKIHRPNQVMPISRIVATA
jgi:NAD(P)H-dependent FMN reductase